jgi:hypothetical protein
MNPKFASYIFFGVLIGAIFGVFWQANSNAIPGVFYGALAGAGLGWFIAAARSQSESKKDPTSKK